MNFNYSNNTSEYLLLRNLIEELINLYGVKVKFVQTKKLNPDDVFGSYKQISADSSSVEEIYILPEETNSWGGSDLFSKFGLQIFDNMSFYISKNTIEKISENIVDVVGSLLIFGNGKVMEITSIDTEVEGASNLFTENNEKNVYLLKTRSYQFNRDDISLPDEFENFDSSTLDEIFLNKTIEKTKEEAKKTIKKRVSKAKDDVFGSL